MNRDEQLEAKRREIQQSLEEWAHRSGILLPGEQVVFSIGIQRVPLVSMTDERPLLDMSLVEFFSPERGKKAGLKIGEVTHIRNALLHVKKWHTEERRFRSVRDLITASTFDICNVRNLGHKSFAKLQRLITAAGLPQLLD